MTLFFFFCKNYPGLSTVTVAIIAILLLLFIPKIDFLVLNLDVDKFSRSLLSCRASFFHNIEGEVHLCSYCGGRF